MDFLNKIYNEDCIETMKRIPDGSIDLMLTDPPYNMTGCEWDNAINIDELWNEWKRIVKPNGVFIITASQPFTSDIVISNKKMFKYEWIWEKHKGTNIFGVKREPLKIHESILIFSEGSFTYNPQMERGEAYKKRGKHNVGKKSGLIIANKSVGYAADFDSEKRYPLSIQAFNNHNQKENSFHPTQKPIDLFRYLVRTYTNEGEIVFDGYMGGGTTAIACIIEKRNFIGSELNKEYYELATNRIETELSQPKLF